MEQEECTPYKFTIATEIDTGVQDLAETIFLLYAGTCRAQAVSCQLKTEDFRLKIQNPKKLVMRRFDTTLGRLLLPSQKRRAKPGKSIER